MSEIKALNIPEFFIPEEIKDVRVLVNFLARLKHEELGIEQLKVIFDIEKQKNQDIIVKKANKLYKLVQKENVSKTLKKRCNDFKKLEKVLLKKNSEK